MYNIYYSLADSEWEGHDLKTDAHTSVRAFMDAVREIRRLLNTMDVEFLPVGDMEFVLWLDGACKGYLSITECGPKT